MSECHRFLTRLLAINTGIVILSLIVVSVAVATDISGQHTGAETWASSGNPYNVSAAATFTSASDLTIEPGVQVVFQGDFTLAVQGHLHADGASGDSIVFRSNDGTPKGKVTVVPTEVWLCSMSYCKLDHLSTGLDLDNTFTVSHSRMTGCTTGATVDGAGVLTESRIDACGTGLGGASSGTLENTVVEGSAQDGVYLNTASYTIRGCTVRNNWRYGLLIEGGGTGRIENSTVQNNGGSGAFPGIYLYGYYGASTFYVTNCQVLDNTGCGVYAYHGTSWMPLYLQLCRFEDNGQDGISMNGYAAIKQLDDVVCGNNGQRGAVVITSEATSFQRCSFVDNGAEGLYIGSASATLTITDAALHGNGSYDLRHAAYTPVTATGNWWGTSDSPTIAAHIYDRSDNASVGIVTFTPFLTEASGSHSIADFDESGRVDGYDLGILGLAFGAQNGDANFDPRCDLNASSRVDGFDLAMFATRFGQVGPDKSPQFLRSCPLAENEAADIVVSMLPSASTLSAGDTVAVRIIAQGPRPFRGLAFDFRFDPRQFDLADLTSPRPTPDAGPSILTLTSVRRAIGQAIIGSIVTHPDGVWTSSTGEVCTVRLVVRETTESETALRFDRAAVLAGADGATATVRFEDLILSTDAPSSLLASGLRVCPNPVRSGSAVFLTGSGLLDQQVELRIFDATGRLLRRLEPTGPPTQRRELSWDCRDDNGRSVPSGVYLCRLGNGATTRDVKLQVVR